MKSNSLDFKPIPKTASSSTDTTSELSHLIMMKRSQSRPNLSKQLLDQKSKDCGGILSLYTPNCTALLLNLETHNVIGLKFRDVDDYLD